MERKSDEVTLFGHRIPKEIYEDYEKIKELKQILTEMINDSNKIDTPKKDEIKKVLNAMSKRFETMQSNKEHKPKFFK